MEPCVCGCINKRVMDDSGGQLRTHLHKHRLSSNHFFFFNVVFFVPAGKNKTNNYINL
jgi:hypothetical protein